MNEGMWKDGQMFFKVGENYGKDPEQTFQVDGLKTPLKPYQAYAVYWMLIHEQTTVGPKGDFLCDMRVSLPPTCPILYGQRMTSTA